MGTSSNKSTQKTVYGKTSTTNPYVISSTNNNGTTSDFIKGSALDTVNNFVNSNISNILDGYLNPSLSSTTNQALLNSYIKNLNSSARTTFENDVINPLSDRKMIRSSQATNMYNNLSNNLSNSLSNYMSELLGQSQQNSADILNNLLNAYLQGFNVVNANQALSLDTSNGNATKTNESSSSSVSPIKTASRNANIAGMFWPM